MSRHTAAFLFLSILFLAVGLRLIGLDRPFVSDEYRTIKFASSPIAEIPSVLKEDAYPPLSYFFMSVWLDVSKNDIWVRLLFVIFGVMSVMLVYYIGAEFIDTRYAMIAMLITAAMPMQVWVSQYVRGIGLAIFFLLLSTLFFLRLLKFDKGKAFRLNASGYVISSIASIYSFYFAFFVLAAQNIIYLFVNRRKGPLIIKWIIFQIVIAVSYLPWLHIFFWQMRNSNVFMNFSVMQRSGLTLWGVKIGTIIRCFAGFLGLDQSFLMNTAVAKDMPYGAMLFISATFLAAVIFGAYLLIWAYKKIAENGHKTGSGYSQAVIFIFFTLFALAPLVGAVLLNVFFKASILARYFAVSSAFIIFVYALLLYLAENRKAAYAFLAAFLIFSVIRVSDFTKTLIDYKTAAIFIKNNIKDGECLLFVGGENAYEHYSRLPANYVMTCDYMKPCGTYSDYSLDSVIDPDMMRRRLGDFNVVWVYHRAEKMSGEVQHVRKAIEALGYKKCMVYAFKNIEIYKYAKMDR